ncbi:O-sialoglycoprotein endopeptidase [Clostridiaceae bacterium HSG29]|nr:O-sialoglycoprotein endopeptidase [Clostridiaceae bacterium HSG29]
MNNDLFLGVDTSCYTTSLSIVDSKGNIILNKRRILKVKNGKQGLRQSEAFFQHVSNLSNLYTELLLDVDVRDIKAISVSSKPRNLEDSYMPVFLSGLYFARNIGRTLNIPIKEFSHQEGHIMASVSSSDFKLYENKKFYLFHLSGGTTELLECEYKKGRFESKIIGGTLDISVGKLIDRVGVKMGFAFPCGKEMDELSNRSNTKKLYPISIKGNYFNLSGIESHGFKNIGILKNEDNAKSLIMSFTKTIYKIIENLDDKDILITGGVSANEYLRNELNNNFLNVYFGSVELSTDNSVGIALLGLE